VITTSINTISECLRECQIRLSLMQWYCQRQRPPGCAGRLTLLQSIFLNSAAGTISGRLALKSENLYHRSERGGGSTLTKLSIIVPRARILARGESCQPCLQFPLPRQTPVLKRLPFHLFQAINGFHLTEAIRSAIELDIFTAIGAGHDTPASIARQCGIAERGARILCDFLVVNGFLTKSGQEYALADDSAMFLDRKSPAYMGTCTRFLLNDASAGTSFRFLTQCVTAAPLIAKLSIRNRP
jgi:hypothetical protein